MNLIVLVKQAAITSRSDVDRQGYFSNNIFFAEKKLPA